MYQGQVMLAPVLTAEENEIVTLSKYETTHGKGTKIKKKKNKK